MGETTVKLESCLDRLRRGDPGARDELIALAYDRLVGLTRKMLATGYARVRRWEESTDVVHNAALRLGAALRQVTPGSVRELFGLVNLQIRRELLDLIRHYEGRKGHEHRGPRPPGPELPEPPEPPTHDPVGLAVWTEFHRLVENLPVEEREVVELLWYQELSQEEAAEILGVDKSTVKRRWRSARLKLARLFKEDPPQGL